MDPKHEIVGVALAGGASTRMGRDKSTLIWPPGAGNGKPLWRHTFDRLRGVTPDVLLADAGRCLAPPSETVPSVPDGPARGPAAGILGAASARPGQSLLVLAVDLPLIPVALLRHLADLAPSDADWILPRRDRGPEPLCSVFGPAALEILRRRAESGIYDLHGLAELSDLRVRHVGDEELLRFGDPGKIFWNVNRPDDWRHLEISSSG
ncbi:MAG: molybdenum cofactor guanylyltransferase [Thermoanaerobaculia bacterium]|nr:molybdenum cofactor guanylyltransferase [Thermoanaerobaculia bacterium]